MPNNLVEAIARLDAHKHWTLKTCNRLQNRAGYECVIWGLGRRVTGYGRTPLLAIGKALGKLHDPKSKSSDEPGPQIFKIIG